MILSRTNTLLEDIEAARKKGFDSEFMFSNNHLMCRTNNFWYQKNDLTLIAYSRQEEMLALENRSFLFLIQTGDGVQGYLSSIYGKDSDIELIDFIMSLSKQA